MLRAQGLTQIMLTLACATLLPRAPADDLTPTTPEGFAEHIRREMPKWRKVVTNARITSL